MPLPRVLLIGDSIRMGYLPFVKAALEDKAEVRGPVENCGDTRRHVQKLEAWLEQPADAIHFNAGLHDLKLPRGADPSDFGTRQVPLAEYAANLEQVAARLKRTGAKVVWASITPVLFERHRTVKDFDRRPEDVAAYNAEAAKVMARHGIPVNDLHAVLAADDLEACLVGDGVHMTERGNKLLCAAVCKAVLG
ncbi:MAG: GDSL-type esterase/lipase family protein [Planctomycetota bacterium]|nr:GDSL-type esterase/lipase family protein [Planctomycetota bacterium]